MNIGEITIVGSDQALVVLSHIIDYGYETHYRGHIGYSARYIDTHTGQLRACPDKRCKNQLSCPICSRSVDRPRQIPDSDIEFFVKEKLVSKALARQHFAARSRPQDDPTVMMSVAVKTCCEKLGLKVSFKQVKDAIDYTAIGEEGRVEWRTMPSGGSLIGLTKVFAGGKMSEAKNAIEIAQFIKS